MNNKIKISTTHEQLKEGLFGQIFLHIFEVLPYLERQNILPLWEIRSPLYGLSPDMIVIPGLLELNYSAGGEKYDEVNLQDLRDDHVVTLGNDWDYVNMIWNKYFHLPERIISRADEFHGLNQALGLHYRGTDRNKLLSETNFVSPEDFLELVRDFVGGRPELDTILIATDENSMVERVQSQHRSLRVLNSGNVIHHKDAVPGNNIGKGEHALLDCLLLSRCKYLLKSMSALSGFAKVLNPGIEAYRLSANKLYFWDIPYFPDAYLPKLTSRDPKCQKILSRLFDGDWTQDKAAMKKYGATFKYQKRKGYMRKERGVPKWSFDGLHKRFDCHFGRVKPIFAKKTWLV